MTLLEEESHLQQTVPLRELYPISIRLILKRSFYWILATLVVVAAVSSVEYQLPVEALRSPPVAAFGEGVRIALYLAVALLLGKILYEIAYFILYYYAIELEHLVVSKRVILKTRASFPIAKINDVHLSRTWLDVLFGIYSLKVMTPSPVAHLGQIHGLSQSDAVALQNHLLALITTTLPKVNAPAAGSVMGIQTSTPDDARVLRSTSARPAPPLHSPAPAPAQKRAGW